MGGSLCLSGGMFLAALILVGEIAWTRRLDLTQRIRFGGGMRTTTVHRIRRGGGEAFNWTWGIFKRIRD